MKFLQLGLILLFCAAIAPHTKANESAQQKLESIVGPQRAGELGLNKLTESEKSAWLRLLSSAASSSSLGQSAIEHLKSEGWEEIVYLGDVRKEFRTYAIFKFGLLQKTYAVESPPLLNLRPGPCLGKVSVLGDGLDSILQKNGREHRFYVDKWIEVE